MNAINNCCFHGAVACCGHPLAKMQSLKSRLSQRIHHRPRWYRLTGCRWSIETAPLTARRDAVTPCAPLATKTQAVRESSESVELALVVGVEVIPRPDKVVKGGEDAFFVSSYNGGTLGVADGVSGWAEQNVDPALFSRELMTHAAAAVGKEEIQNNPQLLLQKAHEETSAIGAATAIIALLERQGVLHIASVGDCGLRIVRKGRILFTTSTQQHYFDCPYQLSSEIGGQTAADAVVYDFPVIETDTIIMGSDGLFDNVYDRDIETTVRLFGGLDKDSAQRTAKALAALASKHAMDVKYMSPYCHEAISQGYDIPLWKKLLGKRLTGGKLDDITVVVGHVINAQSLPREKLLAATKEDEKERTLGH